MKNSPQLVVMLTHHDQTVADAPAVFEACCQAKARYWGFKEDGLPPEQMRELFGRMKACGKTTVLEVVAYDEPACLAGARQAAACGCDILMGTVFYESVADYCREQGLKYMPFVGDITGRPSVLSGRIEDMIAQAREYLAKGVYGIDLLAYRYTGDAEALIRQFTAAIDAPVCLAGSIDSYDRLDLVKQTGAWGFTIGGAFFTHKFGGSIQSQIDRVCDYMA